MGNTQLLSFLVIFWLFATIWSNYLYNDLGMEYLLTENKALEGIQPPEFEFKVSYLFKIIRYWSMVGINLTKVGVTSLLDSTELTKPLAPLWSVMSFQYDPSKFPAIFVYVLDIMALFSAYSIYIMIRSGDS